jgi:hypothetical protein
LIDELKEFVKESCEDEVKSLLFQLLLRISIEEQTEEELAKDLKKTYRSFLNFKYEQKKRENEKDYKAVHIVFGDSASGSLKNTLKEMELQDEEKVIYFSDNFSIGPMWKLEEDRGLAHRHKWLMNHINFDEEYLLKYQNAFRNTLLKINAIPDHVRIMIWVGDNSDEQTALRYVLYLLKDRTNDIILMNTTTNYKNHFAKTDVEFLPIHTGEIGSEKLRVIYERNRTIQPLSLEERKRYENEWTKLSNHKENLRVWENKNICNVDEDYYDDYIIHTAKELHIERKNKDFIKSARLIGEIIGNLNQTIGDQYFEYRLMKLVLKGVFEIEGVPKAMRFYSVKLREGLLS